MAEKGGSSGPERIYFDFTQINGVLRKDHGRRFVSEALMIFGLIVAIIAFLVHWHRAFPYPQVLLGLSLFVGFGLSLLRQQMDYKRIESGTVPADKDRDKMLLIAAYRAKLDHDAYVILCQRWFTYVSVRDMGIVPRLADEGHVLELLQLIRERTVRQLTLFELMRQTIKADTESAAVGVRVAMASGDAQTVSDRLRIDPSQYEDVDLVLAEARRDVDVLLAKR